MQQAATTFTGLPPSSAWAINTRANALTTFFLFRRPNRKKAKFVQFNSWLGYSFCNLLNLLKECKVLEVPDDQQVFMKIDSWYTVDGTNSRNCLAVEGWERSLSGLDKKIWSIRFHLHFPISHVFLSDWV